MKKRKIDENNPVPELIFIPNKISRIISVVLIIIINLCSLIYGVLNFNNFSSDVLVKTVEFGFTIVLSIMALTITVFQSDKNLLKNKNSDKNIKKVYLSYIFIVFPIILILFLGYLIACLFCSIYTFFIFYGNHFNTINVYYKNIIIFRSSFKYKRLNNIIMYR